MDPQPPRTPPGPAKPPLLARRGAALTAALACCALWGSAFPTVKAGLAWFTPTFFAGARFSLAGAAVLTLAAARREAPSPRRRWGPVLAIGLFQTVLGYWFFFHGLKHSSAVSGAILNSSGPVMVAVMARLSLGEGGWGLRQSIGAGCGLAGVLLSLARPGWRPEFTLAGEGFILLSTLSLSYSSILAKRIAARVDALFMAGGSMLSGGLFLLAGAALTEPLGSERFSPAALALLIYASFISAAAFSLWYALLKHNPVSTISTVKFTIPIMGALLSWLLLGEEMTAFKAAGGGLVGMGVYLSFIGRAPAVGPVAGP